MSKKVLKSCLSGSLVAIVISHLIAIIISLIIGDGNFYPTSLGFTKICDTLPSAALLQFITMTIFGAACGGVSSIYQISKWSLLKRTIIHFIILTTTSLITALLAGWIPFYVSSIIIYLALFIIIYVIIWFVIYFTTLKEVKELNNTLRK